MFVYCAERWWALICQLSLSDSLTHNQSIVCAVWAQNLTNALLCSVLLLNAVVIDAIPTSHALPICGLEGRKTIFKKWSIKSSLKSRLENSRLEDSLLTPMHFNRKTQFTSHLILISFFSSIFRLQTNCAKGTESPLISWNLNILFLFGKKSKIRLENN